MRRDIGDDVKMAGLLVDGLNRLDTVLRGKETEASKTALAVTKACAASAF
jgi:hypothetical protein